MGLSLFTLLLLLLFIPCAIGAAFNRRLRVPLMIAAGVTGALIGLIFFAISGMD